MTTADQRGSPNKLSELQWAIGLVGILTFARVIALFVSPLNLGPDEAQYWGWSTDFAFGYFSKPPLIAWIIGVTTALCGDTEAGVRLSAPLFHMGTSLCLFGIARSLFDARTGLWVALTYATLPAVWLASSIMTTDTPLLFFWSLAMFALLRTLTSRHPAWAVLLGVSVGLGLLAKYAMIYFIIGTAFSLVISPQHRWFLTSRNALISMACVVIFLAPNLIWNMANEFSTVSHTAANANWGGDLFNLANLGEFVLGQFGVFGPITFATLLVATFQLRQEGDDTFRRTGIFLLSFVLPILVIVSIQSFISRAHANWAAAAYVAATVFVVAWLMHKHARPWIAASLGLHTVIGLIFLAIIVQPALIEPLGLSNSFKRVRGWETLGEMVLNKAETQNVGTILTEDRLIMAELLFYAQPRDQDIVIWKETGPARNHYELTAPYQPSNAEPLLLVSRQATISAITDRFAVAARLGPHTIELGGGKTRTVYFTRLEGYEAGP